MITKAIRIVAAIGRRLFAAIADTGITKPDVVCLLISLVWFAGLAAMWRWA